MTTCTTKTTLGASTGDHTHLRTPHALIHSLAHVSIPKASSITLDKLPGQTLTCAHTNSLTCAHTLTCTHSTPLTCAHGMPFAWACTRAHKLKPSGFRVRVWGAFVGALAHAHTNLSVRGFGFRVLGARDCFSQLFCLARSFCTVFIQTASLA